MSFTALVSSLRGRWVTLLLLGFLVLLYVPFAGNYGLWDPWEGHYGEVARQMVERNDWISLWWPGSPSDAATFWSKPVLTFWLMALSLKLFGLQHGGAAHAGELAIGWKAEWALRLPFVALGILGVWAVWHLVRRVAGRGAALWSCLVLSTCTQWALITRQAMTDMAFVTPMTVGLAFAGLALILPQDEMTRPLPRKRTRLWGREFSWPHDRAFYGVVALYVLCVVPQLVVDCVQLRDFTFAFYAHSYRTLGLVPMLPFVGLFLLSLPWIAAVRDRRSIYLWVAYITGGIATLAKGPAGIALPAIILLFHVAFTGRWSEFLGQRREHPLFFGTFLPRPLRFLADREGGLEMLRGSLIFLLVGAPWYAAMLARHGLPFWIEMIGDNYVNRAQGRHGDRGTFEYYLRQLGIGMFPWSGVVLAALFGAGRWLRQWVGTPKRQLVVLCLSWFLVDFIVVALVNTKFHHYILPALPALAILAGLLLDEMCQATRGLYRDTATALLLLGLPLTWFCGRDLSNVPARIGWLFNYDYVAAPGNGRPWPVVSAYGERYEYGTPSILTFAILVTLATAVVCFLSWRSPRQSPIATPAADLLTSTSTSPVGDGQMPGGFGVAGGLILFAGLLIASIAIAPGDEAVAYWSRSTLPTSTTLPGWMRWGWLLPAGAAALWMGLMAGLLLRQRLWLPRRKDLAAALGVLGLFAIAWNGWVLDRYLIDLSPHWSQKHIFTTYYKMRRGPQEPIIVWHLYWRGENFYTANQIYDHHLGQKDKTAFPSDHSEDKLKDYLKNHRGRRMFFVMERGALETVRNLLPAEFRAGFHVVDESNNKIYLAAAEL